MASFAWTADDQARLEALRPELAKVSTATATNLMILQGWRNGYMLGIKPLQHLGLGVRLVGRARTCRYLIRRGPERTLTPDERRHSPEITLIESIAAGDVFCVDALGVTTAGIIG